MFLNFNQVTNKSPLWRDCVEQSKLHLEDIPQRESERERESAAMLVAV